MKHNISYRNLYKFKKDDLKEFLKLNGVKRKGNKKRICKRIIKNTTLNSKFNFLKKIRNSSRNEFGKRKEPNRLFKKRSNK